MRYSDPVKIRIEGDQEAGSSYIPLARTFLGQLHATYVEAYVSISGKYSDSYTSANRPQPTEFVARKLTLPNGVNIRVQYNTWMPMIVIEVPAGVGRAKFLEYRGLLRALQDASEPCEPLEPPTGTPGDEDYDPGEFSELHPLHVPTDPEQQWLIYPAGISTEHNGFPNHPLPSRGGTFIMDMIGVPFDQRAFGVRGKPPLTDCKMLVTGGGTTGTVDPEYAQTVKDGYLPEPVFELLDVPNRVYGDLEEYYICPPRKFRIGRRNEMPGWPWLDTRNPEQQFTRLVSVSAVMEHDYDFWGEEQTANILVEFLKLNGEPFESDEDGYLEPIEIEQTDLGVDAGRGFGPCLWYDFTVTSITPRGNKAILGLNSLGYGWYRGTHFDFVVLDLEAENEPTTFISRYDLYKNEWTNCTNSETGAIDNIFIIEEDTSFLEDPEFNDHLGNPVYWKRAVVRQSAVDVNGNEYYTNQSRSTSYLGEVTYFLHFDAQERLVRSYLKYTGTDSSTATQTLTTEAGSNGTTLGEFLTLESGYSTSSLVSYVAGQIRVIVASYNNITYNNIYLCVQNHTGAFARRPRLMLSGGVYVDAAPDYWRFVWGERPGNPGCVFQSWNGFTTIDPLDCDEGGTPSLAVGQYGICGNFLWMNAGAGTRAVLTGQGTAQNKVRQNRLRDSDFSVTAQLDFCQAVVDLPLTETIAKTWATTVTGNNTFWDERRMAAYSCMNGWGVDPGGVGAYTQNAVHYNWLTTNGTETFAGMTASPTTYSAPGSCGLGVVFNPTTPTVLQSASTKNPTYCDAFTVDTGPFYWDGIELSGPNQILCVPMDGIGLLVFPTLERSSQLSGTCVTNVSSWVYRHQRNCCIAVPSQQYFSDDPEVVFTSRFWDVTWGDPMIETAYALADPLPYVYGADPLPPNDGLKFKPVWGPEKGITCDEQQISYVGWLYPQELQSDD